MIVASFGVDLYYLFVATRLSGAIIWRVKYVVALPQIPFSSIKLEEHPYFSLYSTTLVRSALAIYYFCFYYIRNYKLLNVNNVHLLSFIHNMHFIYYFYAPLPHTECSTQSIQCRRPPHSSKYLKTFNPPNNQTKKRRLL